jgi:glutathione S-transferase
VPYTLVGYGDGDPEEERWKADKLKMAGLGFAFPNLPFLQHGGARLTQSVAILQHLGRAYGLEGATPEEKDRCDLFVQQAVDFRSQLSGYAYRGSPDIEGVKALPFVGLFDAAVGARAWCAGESLTVADFILCETLLHWRAIMRAKGGVAEPLAAFPRLDALVAHFEALPGVTEFLASEEVSSLPYNGEGANFR